MQYFDTDVLVNYCVEQHAAKHKQTVQLLDQAMNNNQFLISIHSLNELAFVLAKLKLERLEIIKKVSDFYVTQPVIFTILHFQRAMNLAEEIGFQHMSDCLHTAIAEAYCTELVTYNQSDFKRIQPHTPLKITIL